jgi:hypothetical protein
VSNYDLPQGAPLDAFGNFVPAWAQWLTRTHANTVTLQQSGPTAERPDKMLWVGRQFFDTTLGHPIWLQSINPTVWCDATGAAV